MGHSPAVVAAHAPHADADDGLGVEHAAVHGVHQAQHVVLQDQVHVLPLRFNEKTAYSCTKLRILRTTVATEGCRFSGQDIAPWVLNLFFKGEISSPD